MGFVCLGFPIHITIGRQTWPKRIIFLCMFFSTWFVYLWYTNGTDGSEMGKQHCLDVQWPYNLHNNIGLCWHMTNQMSCPDAFTWMGPSLQWELPGLQSYKTDLKFYIWFHRKENLVSRILVSFLMEKDPTKQRYTCFILYFHAQVLFSFCF